MLPRTLLVIPSFRDADRLAPFLHDLSEQLPSSVDILVSDDGSGSKDFRHLENAIVQARRQSNSKGPNLLEPITAPRNRGKGAAVRAGWAAKGNYSFFGFADADGAVGAREILRAASQLSGTGSEADALFASRVKMLGRTVERRIHRHLAGRVYATFVAWSTRLPAYDTQCGFKLVRAAALRDVLPFLACDGFAFDCELALVLRRRGWRVEEIPVDWSDIAGSKVKLLRDSLRMTFEVIQIKSRLHGIPLRQTTPEQVSTSYC